MRRGELEPLSPELRGLLESERAVPEQPQAVRDRAVLRARAALRAGSVSARGKLPSAGVRWLIAAATVLIAANLLATALRAQRHATESLPDASATSAVSRRSLARSHETEPAPFEPEARAPESAGPSTAQPQVPTPHAVPAVEVYTLELKLLAPARVAVAQGDFASALTAIAAHARRFPGGRLAEEREALRVQALSGLGRAKEAQRAASAFRQRFPSSILLSRMKQP